MKAPVFLLLLICTVNQLLGNGFPDPLIPSHHREIDSIVKLMTLEEKVGQMTQINIDLISKGKIFALASPHEIDTGKLNTALHKYHVGSILNVGGHTYSVEHWREIMAQIHKQALLTRTKIPVIYGIDAIHGVNYTVGATLFPQQIGMAATWNPSLVQQGASVTAYECRASGIPWNFSPVLDMGRQPLWSRFFETYGEDVFLAKTMTKAAVEGYQGKDPSSPYKVAACMKHFLGYSFSLSGKDRTPAWIPERQLREYFLPTFQQGVESGALTVMINSGELNGIPVHANKYLLTDVLRKELGFKGIALTDWEDIIKLYKVHKIAHNMKEAVKIAIDAGIDMSMTPNDYSFNHALIELVKEGSITEERLDSSCKRILWVKKKLGLLASNASTSYEKFGSKTHQLVALESAIESITLLKNNNKVLPLNKKSNLLVCGPAANSLNLLNGAWTHTWQGVDTAYNTKGVPTILEALIKESKGEVTHLKGEISAYSKQEIALMLKDKNAIVICLGEKPSTEKPGDINDLELSKNQQELVRNLSGKDIPLIFVMCFNRPLLVQKIEPLADAILHAYLPGDMGGKALSKLVFGERNPSGKLPFSYPRYSGDLMTYDHKYSEQVDPNFGLNAFHPQWEFGTGLSYAQFSYSNVELNKKTFKTGDTLKISVDVTNNSQVEGKEVAMVFISDLVASITPSVRRLRAFEKVFLPPNETQKLHFLIPLRDLFFVGKNQKWTIEAGEYEINIANQKQIIKLE